MSSIAHRAFAVACLLAPVLAQGDTAPTPATLRVKCVDAHGKPVANAIVEVLVPRAEERSTRFEHRASLRSDANGECEALPDASRIGWVGPWVHARVPGQLVGVRSIGIREKTDTITVVLTPPGTLRGSIRVPDDVHAASVRVRVVAMRDPTSADREAELLPRVMLDATGSLHAEVEKVLPGRLLASVASDGSFELAEVPATMELEIEASGAGLAVTRRHVSIAPDAERVEITVPREAVLAGRVVAPGGKPGAETVVMLTSDTTWAIANRRSPSSSTALADADGRFRFGGLADGQYVLSLRSTDGCFRPAPVTLATAEQRTAETLQLETGLEITGTVLAADDRSPIANAMVRAAPSAKSFVMQDITWTRTDAEGRFVLRVPAGAAWLHVGAPKFATPEPRELQLGGSAATPAALEVLLQRR